MSTKLFLRSTQSNGIGATYFDMLPVAGSGTATGVVGTAASGTEIQWTQTAGGAVLQFISGRAPAGGFTLTATDISIWAQESNGQANAGGRYRVFKRAANGTETEIGGGPFNDGVEFGTSAAEMLWTGNVTDTAFAENDRILLKLYITNVGTMGGSRTCTLTYNGANAATGDSFFNIAETVAFKAEEISGSLSVQEAAADTASASGKVIVQGAAAATESGTDAFAASGDVIVAGALAASEAGTDAFAASGTVAESAVTGSLAATEAGADSFSGSGRVVVQGACATAESGVDTLAAAGAVRVTGSLAASEPGADGLSATGKVVISGAAALSEAGQDALAATGSIVVQGTLAAVEAGSDTFAGVGGQEPVTGALSAHESGEDVLSASGGVSVQGALAAAETGQDSLTSAGSVVVSGALAVIDESDSFAATGLVLIQGGLSAVESGHDCFFATNIATRRWPLAGRPQTYVALPVQPYPLASRKQTYPLRRTG